MTKRTVSNKTNFSILKVSGFRARMSSKSGRNIINKRRKKKRHQITV